MAPRRASIRVENSRTNWRSTPLLFAVRPGDSRKPAFHEGQSKGAGPRRDRVRTEGSWHVCQCWRTSFQVSQNLGQVDWPCICYSFALYDDHDPVPVVDGPIGPIARSPPCTRGANTKAFVRCTSGRGKELILRHSGGRLV